VRQVGYLPKLYDDARSEKYKIQLALSNLISLRLIFIIILPDTPRPSKKALASRFPDQNFVCTSLAVLHASPIATAFDWSC